MRTVFAMLPIAFLAALLGCTDGGQNAGFQPTVDVVEVTARDIPLYREFVGETHGKKDIAIRARVEGYLEGIHFQEGLPVRQGQLLYTIESQPFEEAVAAKMSVLAEATTMRAKAESDLNRYRPLAAQNAVSQSDLDAAVAQYDASQAAVEAAEANLRAARINLGYTRVKSPIHGLIGSTNAKVGDFVGREPNPVILNTVSQIDTVLVKFFISENDYLQVARRFAGRAQDPSSRQPAEGRKALELILSDGTIYPYPGVVDFIDRGIDPTTGAILVQASFPNPSGLLRPGQFARVRGEVERPAGGFAIPQRCVMELQGTYSVYLVNDSSAVQLQSVEVGPTVGNFWIITSGLHSGDRVIYEGLQSVRPGMTVQPMTKEVTLVGAER